MEMREAALRGRCCARDDRSDRRASACRRLLSIAMSGRDCLAAHRRRCVDGSMTGSLPAVVEHGQLMAARRRYCAPTSMGCRAPRSERSRRRRQGAETLCEARGMSVQRDRDRWRVRWREGEKQRSRTFDRKGDADRVRPRDVRRRAARPAPPSARPDRAGDRRWPEFIAPASGRYAATPQRRVRASSTTGRLSTTCRARRAVAVRPDVPRLRRPPAVPARPRADAEHGPRRDDQAVGHPAGRRGARPASRQRCVRALRKVPATPREEVAPAVAGRAGGADRALRAAARAIVLLAGHLGLRPEGDPARALVELRRQRGDGRPGPGRSAARAHARDLGRRGRPRRVEAWRLRPAGRDDDPIVGPLSGRPAAVGVDSTSARPPASSPAATT